MFDRLRVVLSTALTLRCPACQQGKIFARLWHTHPRCARCGQTYYMGPGEFTGGVYINYGLTTMLALIAFFPLDAYTHLSEGWELLILCAFATIFPLFSLRNSRAAFMAIMYTTGALEEPPPDQASRAFY